MKLNIATLPARSDFVDATYRVLVDAITDGSLAPGERLTQEEIAEQLHVSRSPVLQALRLLKKDGFIEDAPGRGVQVAQLDIAWVANLYQVRGALDALAARLAAQSRSTIDPALMDRGRRAAEGDDLRAIIDTDLAFHNAIYLASGNPLIAESAERHWMHLRRVMGAVHRVARHRATLWDEHQSIADAIAQGDAERAVELSDLHISRASTNLVGELRKLYPLATVAAPRA
ncbi:GntR family transcriptional regulator [Pseudorhodoferax soli]|uniref:GntR family transcriptional regulator n=1 Tax=Pseudorhodoferax soli TaxID=545864 RepID=A0A368XL18_9BURK|nr:GntR family transcriptional regulator [Pseudorhodoferax soli]RCW68663.1 GntR family transcriptional regulator [Pseudorhodoferax soli]